MNKIRWNFRKNLARYMSRLAIGVCAITLFCAEIVLGAEKGMNMENYIWKTQSVDAWAKVLEASLDAEGNNTEKDSKKTKKT